MEHQEPQERIASILLSLIFIGGRGSYAVALLAGIWVGMIGE